MIDKKEINLTIKIISITIGIIVFMGVANYIYTKVLSNATGIDPEDIEECPSNKRIELCKSLNMELGSREISLGGLIGGTKTVFYCSNNNTEIVINGDTYPDIYDECTFLYDIENRLKKDEYKITV